MFEMSNVLHDDRALPPAALRRLAPLTVRMVANCCIYNEDFYIRATNGLHWDCHIDCKRQ